MGVLNRKDRRALLKKGNIENVVAGAINQTHSKIRLDTINDLMALNSESLEDIRNHLRENCNVQF